MEIKLNLKQLVFVSIWILLLIVALLLSTTRAYYDILGRAETFGELPINSTIFTTAIPFISPKLQSV